jgi:DNA sulfur modification protein DndB
MAIVVPAIRGKLGNTVYYQAKMKVRELVTGVRPANELDEWATMGIEERMQREPNLKRIEKEIAPYIANTRDRFFGSVIVLVYKGEIYFEGLKDLGAKIPRAYQSVAQDTGFITIDGGSLIMLDGQHRLLALEKVFKNEVKGQYNDEVQDDEISVVFIQHENNMKTRRIFNKVNRYAKSTSRGDNIITSEDDAYAIVSRRLLDDGAPLGMNQQKEELVDWKNNTLSARSTKLTTISVVYETVKMILQSEGKEVNIDIRPSDEELAEYYDIVERYWKIILEKISPYQLAISNVSKIPEMRNEKAKYSLLFKPAAQLALFKGIIMAVEKGLILDQAVERANKIDWCMTSDLWKDIIVRQNGTIDPKVTARDKAAHLIMYMIAADKLSQEEIEAIREEYNKARGKENEELPAHVVE